VARERDRLGPSLERLGDLLVARGVGIRSQRLANGMAAEMIPTRDPEALAATITFALTGYHLSLRFFGQPPAGVSDESLITTLVDLVAGGQSTSPPRHDAARACRRGATPRGRDAVVPDCLSLNDTKHAPIETCSTARHWAARSDSSSPG
jgi:hypothetical protein